MSTVTKPKHIGRNSSQALILSKIQLLFFEEKKLYKHLVQAEKDK